MAWINQDKVAIVGIGATPYYVRGGSAPQTLDELVGKAILAACEDAGIGVQQIDGFATYMGGASGYGAGADVVSLVETLGIPEIHFTAAVSGGGGGSAAAIGLAAAAIANEDATIVVTCMGLQQIAQRLGKMAASVKPSPANAFLQPAGLIGAGHLYALLAQRHMYLYGTRRDAYCEVVVTQRANAANRPCAIRRTTLSRDDYFRSAMLADPLCRLDFCLESDGAIAIITTSIDRARDLRQKPILLHACAQGGERAWGRSFNWMGMPDPIFSSSGNGLIATSLWNAAGLGPKDVDVALLYDHFSPAVVTQLEDFGFCKQGEGGPFVESGAIRHGTGSIPVNTHGGQLSEAYVLGMTHIREAVEQLRGVAVNQVAGAQVALVTGGPGPLPSSALLLRN